MPDKPPRRRVVHSNQTVVRWSNLFDCLLECGHTATAAGRANAPGQRKEAPKSVGCWKCAALETAGRG
jgi:hypothetical protein